jgi:hypothetical protein
MRITFLDERIKDDDTARERFKKFCKRRGAKPHRLRRIDTTIVRLRK